MAFTGYNGFIDILPPIPKARSNAEVQITNNILNFLQLRSWSYHHVADILGYYGLRANTKNIEEWNKILKELADSKVVYQRLQGSSAYPQYRIAVESWDHANPFKPVKDDEDEFPKDDMETWDKPENKRANGVRFPNVGESMIWLNQKQSYEYREQIKKIPGWYYDPQNKVWSIPHLEYANLSRITNGNLQKSEAEGNWTFTEYHAKKIGSKGEVKVDKKPVDMTEEVPVPRQVLENFERVRSRVEILERSITNLGSSGVQKILDIVKEHKEWIEGVDKVSQDQLDMIKELQTKVETLQRSKPRVIEVKKYDGTTKKLKDKVLPKEFDRVLNLVRCRRNVLLVGPAGAGKTYVAELVAEALSLPFYKVGGSAGLTEEHLLGYSRPNLTGGKDRFVSTPFLTAYEKGGVCLLDELDAADSNVLLALNPALDASGNLPVRERGDSAKKHKDFACVATANTFGKGADRVYSGRNQLDEATLDRFRVGVVEIDYDPAVESSVLPHKEVREWLQKVRENVVLQKIRRVVSIRFMVDCGVMIDNCDWNLSEVADALFSGWTKEEVSKGLSGLTDPRKKV